MRDGYDTHTTTGQDKYMTSSAIRLLDGGTVNRYRNTSTERGIALVFRPQWLSGQAGFRGMKHMPITSQNGRSDAPHG